VGLLPGRLVLDVCRSRYRDKKKKAPESQSSEKKCSASDTERGVNTQSSVVNNRLLDLEETIRFGGLRRGENHKITAVGLKGGEKIK